jgi:outer membrane biosynthesis protein TonB
VHHFLRQQVRIPTEEDCNIRRFIQLALNAGQLLGSTTQKERQKFGYSMTLTDPNTYLDSDSRAIFSKLITKEDVKAVKEYYNREYEQKTGSNVKSKPKPKPKSGVKSKPKPKPKSGVKSKPKPKPKSGVKSKPKPKHKSKK